MSGSPLSGPELREVLLDVPRITSATKAQEEAAERRLAEEMRPSFEAELAAERATNLAAGFDRRVLRVVPRPELDARTKALNEALLPKLERRLYELLSVLKAGRCGIDHLNVLVIVGTCEDIAGRDGQSACPLYAMACKWLLDTYGEVALEATYRGCSSTLTAGRALASGG